MAEHYFEFLSLKEAAQAHLSLHFSKCHIVENHMLRLNYVLVIDRVVTCISAADRACGFIYYGLT